MRDLRARLDRATTDSPASDLSPLGATFLRGLSLGALVGAAIAGSAIWRRVREGREVREEDESPPVVSSAGTGSGAETP